MSVRETSYLLKRKPSIPK